MNALSSVGSSNITTSNNQTTSIETNLPLNKVGDSCVVDPEKAVEPRDLSDYKISRSTSPNIETAIDSVRNLVKEIDKSIDQEYHNAIIMNLHLLCHGEEGISQQRRYEKIAEAIATETTRENYRHLAFECIDNSRESITINQFLKQASDEERVTFFSHALAEPNVRTAIVEHLHDIMVGRDLENKSGINYLSKAYQRLYSNKTGRKDIPEGGKVDDTVPVNFIWVGSSLPDRYLENVKSVASATPHREVVIWIDRDWMTPAEYSKMKALPTLPELEGLNCKVLDINYKDLTKVIPERSRKFIEAIEFLRQQCDHKAMASDLIRYALLANGSDAIDKASHSKTKRATKGMIYLDTDRGPTEPTLTQWGEMQAPAGILFQNNINNDFLVTTFERHPVILSALNMAIDRLEKNKQKLVDGDRSTDSFSHTVLETTGPVTFADALFEFTKCTPSYFFAKHLELDSPVAGPFRWDKTWVTSSKVDLSSTWTPPKRTERSCTIL